MRSPTRYREWHAGDRDGRHHLVQQDVSTALRGLQRAVRERLQNYRRSEDQEIKRFLVLLTS